MGALRDQRIKLCDATLGQYLCGDAGWSPCSEFAGSLCSNPLGECAGARRRFSDDAGCSMLSYSRPDAGWAAIEAIVEAFG